ncbi:NAD-dependent epimerase/dehydratase family protein [Croceibacter atlanticus]|uniref:NAD-dependent epimerase/dehydratase family protein n=1 Tax=Croceibacter atlanticus TaxID=313588 RepID=UPI0024BA8E1E|nr:NAD-dependent epimerase/dehydratase family protein [Croceibacter atlanticus]WSP33516.1 NAD-dependent epimerase/dehydratase family protein [Croceibacter atlanticus]
MNTVLITGAAGNIGSALAVHLASSGKYNVIAIDNLCTGDVSKLGDYKSLSIEFIKADANCLSTMTSIILSRPIDYIFHYAAMVGVQRTLDNPIGVLDDIDGIKNILNIAKNTGVRKVIFSSSSEVYGEPVSLPQNEEITPLNSKLPYAVVKNVGECFLKSFHKEYGLNYNIFRFFNTYGPNQSIDFVIPKLLHQALNNAPITIFGDGEQSRTFCFIDDNIDASISIFENENFNNTIFNIGNDIVYTINELVKVIIKVTNSTSEIIHLPALDEGDMTRRCPDISKMKAVLQRDLIPLEEGIRRMLKAIKR